MAIELLPFQVIGRDYLLSHPRTLLADDMGLGKTVQAIAALSSITFERCLIVCPASLRLNWLSEIKKFAPELLPKVTATSYEQAYKHASIAYDVLICDEAHYLKNPVAKRTKAVLEMGMLTPRVWFLSGTPITSCTPDSFTIFNFCAPSHFPSTYWEFAKEYSYPYQTSYGWSFHRSKNLSKLYQLGSKHVFLRRKKEEVLKDLPAKRYHTRYVETATKAELNEIKSLCDSIDTDTLDTDSEHMVTIRRKLASLKALPCAEVAKGILQEKEKLVIFGYFTDSLDILAAKLGKDLGMGSFVKITGSTSTENRHTAVHLFQNDKNVRVFIGNIVAAGTGLTLTAADTVLFLERDWVPANNLQAEDRIHRIGQKNCCNIIDLVVADTIDEAVLGVLKAKQKTIKGALDGIGIERASSEFGARGESTQASLGFPMETSLELPWES